MQVQSRDLPEKIVEEDAKLDHFTESGSDNQNNFEMKVPPIDKLMKEFEQGDETMKGVKEKPSEFTTQYAEELVKLNNNIRYFYPLHNSVQRIATAAKVDTAVEQLNGNITKPQYKLYF